MKNESNQGNLLKDEQITRAEFRNLLKAMDKEGFYKNMEDYMAEISDPKNVIEKNEYLRTAETNKDLPANVKLAQPTKGFCVKSEKFSVKRPNQRQKVFINICSIKEIDKPYENKGMWSLPHLINKGKNDQDKKGKLCTTYDIVFNPEAINLSKKNPSFQAFLCDSAINGINNNLLKADNEKISKDYTIKSKFDYKGLEVDYINIHSLTANELDSRKEPVDNYKTEVQKEIEQIKNSSNNEFDNKDKYFDNVDNALEEEKGFSKVPEYKIKYSDKVELTKYFYNPNSKVEGPNYQTLIIEIKVPKVENLNSTELELNVKKINFKYKDIYELSADLPVEVNKDKSQAKFDRKSGIISISAPIIRKQSEVLEIIEDENIEIIKDEDNKQKIIDKRNIEDKSKESEEFRKQNLISNNLNKNIESNVDKDKDFKNISQNPEKKEEEEYLPENKDEIKITEVNSKIELVTELNNNLKTESPKIEKLENKENLDVKLQEEKDEDDNIDVMESNEDKTNDNKISLNINFFNFHNEMIYEID